MREEEEADDILLRAEAEMWEALVSRRTSRGEVAPRASSSSVDLLHVRQAIGTVLWFPIFVVWLEMTLEGACNSFDSGIVDPGRVVGV